MAAGLVSLFVAAAMNLCWSVRGTLVTAVSAVLTVALGYSHLRDWYRANEPELEIKTVEVSQPMAKEDGGSDREPEGSVILALVNRWRRPIVIAPAWGPGLAGPEAPSHKAVTRPGQWLEEWGEPDVTLHLDRDGSALNIG